MLPDLARDHTVIAWVAPGFGQSSDIDDTWRAAQLADALIGFIAAVGLERPHLVGHSFGTIVAVSLFQRHLAVPASLVLGGGYAGWAGSPLPEEVARGVEMFLGMDDLGDAFDPKSCPGLFTDLIPVDRGAALVTMMRENICPASVRAAGYFGVETDLRAVLPAIDTDTRPARRGRRSVAAHERRNAACGDLDITARCAPEARTRVCGRGPRGVCEGDSLVREERGLRVPAADRRRARFGVSPHRGGCSSYVSRVAGLGPGSWCTEPRSGRSADTWPL